MSSKDEIVGSVHFNKEEIKKKKEKNSYFWLNLYGSQLSPDSQENALIMNSNPNLGSFWKGRVLIAIEIFEDPLPKLTDKPLPLPETILQGYNRNSMIQWKLYIEIFYGLLFPEEKDFSNGKFSLQIRWADQEINTEVKSPENGVWEWYSRYNITCEFPYFNADELPDIFIYIRYKDKRICFIRKPASFFLHKFTNEPQHYFFAPDKSIMPNLKDDEAGILKFRCVVAISQAISNLSIGGWNTKISKEILKKTWLFAHIYQAQDLIPADSDGNSDAFIELNYYGCKSRTETVYDSLNPVYF